jgi:hypothetical protein
MLCWHVSADARTITGQVTACQQLHFQPLARGCLQQGARAVSAMCRANAVNLGGTAGQQAHAGPGPAGTTSAKRYLASRKVSHGTIRHRKLQYAHVQSLCCSGLTDTQQSEQ